MLKIINPIDGDCLNMYDGIYSDDNLVLRVVVESDTDNVFINGIQCTPCTPSLGNQYTAQITINEYDGFITAENKKTGEVAGIRIYYNSNRVNYYRISVDDSILFLKDINDNRNIYESVFENPFLSLMKKAHDLYGAKIHINLFYEYNNPAMNFFQNHKQYFNLSMMTDKFKGEFTKNAEWLHLSFHSQSEFPDRPYDNTSYQKIDRDIKLVKSEIKRFAGDIVSPPVTTLHWGASNETGVRALRANGYKLLNGEFDETQDGKAFVSYHYPAEFTRHIRTRDFWKDHSLDVIFSKYDAVLNKYRHISDVKPIIDNIITNPHVGGFAEFLTHEQYFYDDYKSYIPNYSDILLSVCKQVTEKNYKGMFFTDFWNLNSR